MVTIYDRASKSLVEVEEYQAKWLQFLYQHSWGRLLEPLVTSRLFSFLWTRLDYTSLSSKKIESFIRTYGIHLEDYQEQNYKTFADFFTRKLKADRLPNPVPKDQIVSVAQAKLLVLTISDQDKVLIKGQLYSLADLLQDQALADYYRQGMLFVYRLAVEDYHRYLACETGQVTKLVKLKGKLHSVRHMAQTSFQVFKENKRQYTLIQTPDGAQILQMEIGALLVGRINNPECPDYQKGQEKGWFSLGGSTILVAYPKDTVIPDQDLIDYSCQGIETQVNIGERIGLNL